MTPKILICLKKKSVTDRTTDSNSNYKIPQLDGDGLSTSFTSEVASNDAVHEPILDLSFLPFVNIWDCDDCGFCISSSYEYIQTVNEYLEHLKRYGQICYNCTDYFLEFPWFKSIHPDLIDDQDCF